MARKGAYQNILLSKSLTVSGNNLSAITDNYLFVKAGSAVDTVVPAASGDLPLGVNDDTGISGDSIAVNLVGITKLRLAGSVSAGNRLKVTSGTSDGRAIAATVDEIYGAIALQPGSSGEVIAALLKT